MTQRIGLLGGTFDPIHNAHLRMAEFAAQQCDLVSVLLVPAGNPPHRARGTYAGYEDRLRMVEIAAAPYPNLVASRLEETSEKSYSIRTVERLRTTLGHADSIYFIIGADAFAEIRTWHRWQELARLVTFAVVSRPGAIYESPDGVSIERVEGLKLTVSSSQIRARLAAGDPDVDVPPQVLDYIRAHHLYITV